MTDERFQLAARVERPWGRVELAHDRLFRARGQSVENLICVVVQSPGHRECLRRVRGRATPRRALEDRLDEGVEAAVDIARARWGLEVREDRHKLRRLELSKHPLALRVEAPLRDKALQRLHRLALHAATAESQPRHHQRRTAAAAAAALVPAADKSHKPRIDVLRVAGRVEIGDYALQRLVAKRQKDLAAIVIEAPSRHELLNSCLVYAASRARRKSGDLKLGAVAQGRTWLPEAGAATQKGAESRAHVARVRRRVEALRDFADVVWGLPSQQLLRDLIDAPLQDELRHNLVDARRTPAAARGGGVRPLAAAATAGAHHANERIQLRIRAPGARRGVKPSEDSLLHVRGEAL
mmetsp:Transcript_126844/g.316994  ORF Transcript_126844/g.316994 Transcript_126844/m.316994 type:complete len:353 (+) Transcript_126844:646-1704(+)